MWEELIVFVEDNKQANKYIGEHKNIFFFALEIKIILRPLTSVSHILSVSNYRVGLNDHHQSPGIGSVGAREKVRIQVLNKCEMSNIVVHGASPLACLLR